MQKSRLFLSFGGRIARSASGASTSSSSVAVGTESVLSGGSEGLTSARNRTRDLMNLWKENVHSSARPGGLSSSAAPSTSTPAGPAAFLPKGARAPATGGGSALSLRGRRIVAGGLSICAGLAAARWGPQALGLGAHQTTAAARFDPPAPTAAREDDAPTGLFWSFAGLFLPTLRRITATLALVLNELVLAARALFLGLLFTPVIATAPLALMYDVRRDLWVQLLRWTLEQAGPAFIKWGQWAASRPDLLPGDVCTSLKHLHSGAPCHSFAYSKKSIEAAFGQPLHVLFESIEEKPVASGSIAQVHCAVLTEAGARGTRFKAGTRVAIKVRHPGVHVVMERDFALMARFAAISRRLPVLSDLRLDESVRQFGAPMREQLDLAEEARNLARFNHNFKKWRGKVSFPEPLLPLVSSTVLVETFEEGELIDRIVDNPLENKAVRTPIAVAGLNSYFKMLLHDNLVHADLHPGNILVRFKMPEDSFWGLVKQALGLRVDPLPHLILLDVGMIAELTRRDLSNVREFFASLTSLDGERMGRTMLTMSEQQTCPNPSAFIDEVREKFRKWSETDLAEHTGEVFGELMDAIRRHHVHMEGSVSTVVVTALVLEGWSSKLDPDLKIMDTLREMLPQDWTGRVSRIVDRIVDRWSASVSVL